MTKKKGLGLAIVACAVPVFMVSLDNLVVTMALTSIHSDFGSDAARLQWVVNAYILGFAGFLLAGAGLGDRFGRRRIYLAGLAVFTLASAGCGLASGLPELIAARALQGVAAGVVMPLSLTLLSEAVPDKMRSAAVGIWSGISGLGIAMGPLIGGVVINGLEWRWIFWVNLPVGLLAIPFAAYVLRESHGARRPLDLPGLVLSSGSVLALVWAIVHGHDDGWTSGTVLTAFAAAGVLLALFVLRELHTPEPMLPLSFYRSRAFVGTNIVSLAMNFGVFGSIFLLAQYLQFAEGLTPLQAGVRTLAWTLMPMVFAPLAGALTERVGGGRLMVLGLVLQALGLAWIVSVAEPGTPFSSLIGPMMVAGTGMGLVFAPASAVVLQSVRVDDRGRASGANSTVREIGGALGIAVLASVFSRDGSYASPQAFVDGMAPAVWVGVAVVLAGAVAGLLIPRRPVPPAEPPLASPQVTPVAVAAGLAGDADREALQVR
jgi:EmrB/QacA subfamily drug resistance transporter